MKISTYDTHDALLLLSFVLLLIPVYVTLILYNRMALVEFMYQIFPRLAQHIKVILPDVIVYVLQLY